METSVPHWKHKIPRDTSKPQVRAQYCLVTGLGRSSNAKLPQCLMTCSPSSYLSHCQVSLPRSGRGGRTHVGEAASDFPLETRYSAPSECGSPEQLLQFSPGACAQHHVACGYVILGDCERGRHLSLSCSGKVIWAVMSNAEVPHQEGRNLGCGYTAHWDQRGKTEGTTSSQDRGMAPGLRVSRVKRHEGHPQARGSPLCSLIGGKEVHSTRQTLQPAALGAFSSGCPRLRQGRGAMCPRGRFARALSTVPQEPRSSEVP